MDIGVLLPTGTTLWGAGEGPRELLALGRRAERSGFSSLFVNDSLTGPRVEALTALAALAPVTDNVTLGTAALLPFLRRPVQAAQSLASLDLLSGGRLVVTVGAGFPGRFGRPLYALSQVPWERRFARLDETVALWRALWDGAPSFHGEFFHADELPSTTRPFRTAHPPVWLGGATPAALERAGRLYDGWLPYPPDPADYASGLAAVHGAAAGAGRDRGGITPALFVSVRIDDDAAGGRRVLDDYARAAYGLPLTELEKIQAVVTGTAAHVLDRLLEYAAAGARHLVVRLAAPDLRSQSEQLDRLAALIPAGGAPTATGAAPASGRQ
ncbi:LLM class flavin-dependent oxidoreductase [Streptomyces sp. NPDC008150]|uniref:LLM class flavin-dependent oxidoreductase n=1 Tax=Streptomyces sp. NPDC008150 TaxID=3364816 RepID=UPI0036ECDFC5